MAYRRTLGDVLLDALLGPPRPIPRHRALTRSRRHLPARRRRHAPDCNGRHCQRCGWCLNKNYYFKANQWSPNYGKHFCWKCIRKVK